MELFRYPITLAWLAAAFAVLVVFRFKAEERRLEAARRLLGPAFDRLGAGPEAARRRLRGLLYFTALGLLAVAAAGPQWGVELSPITDLKGNVVIAVDTSLSMGARDLKPDRLFNARLLLGAIARKFEDYRIGVVAFAGEAYVQCPLTTDQDAITYFASALKPGMLPSQGTDFSEAIDTTLGMLFRYGGQKVLVLITDGEDHSAGLDTALKAAAGQNLKIFTVGIGTPDGELVPMTDSAGNTLEYKKDKSGKTVVSRMDEAALMKIASRTGAAYLRYTDPDSAAEAVRSAVAALDLEKSRGKGRSVYKDRYQWPLAAALLLLLIELMVMEKGFRLVFKLPDLKLPFRKGGAAALLLFAALCSPSSSALAAGPGPDARKGGSAYGKKDWPAAVEYYSRAKQKAPADKRLDLNIGDAYYRQEDYAKAGELFEQAAASPKVAAKANYNRGNALFRSGDAAGAVAAYRKALSFDPKDENAKFNLQKALEQKKKNSCPNPDDKKDKDKKDQEKKKQDQDKKEDGGGGKDDQEKEKRKEQEKKKAEARERSRQILEMMKEKEKAAARDPEALRQAAMKQGKPPPQDRLEDW
ncbi:MAG: VWA domain-containing protein [Elusimicrobia bacterium]|nr:VWA domain-containing protein [Elusimicrobiota bacterium]